MLPRGIWETKANARKQLTSGLDQELYKTGLVIHHESKEFAVFFSMKAEDSSPCSQTSATVPYPEPVKSSPRHPHPHTKHLDISSDFFMYSGYK
jgi:hypothetical protein